MLDQTQSLQTKIKNNNILFLEHPVPFQISAEGISHLSEISNQKDEIIKSFDALMLLFLESNKTDLDLFKEHLKNAHKFKTLLFNIDTLEIT